MNGVKSSTYKTKKNCSARRFHCLLLTHTLCLLSRISISWNYQLNCTSLELNDDFSHHLLARILFHHNSALHGCQWCTKKLKQNSDTIRHFRFSFKKKTLAEWSTSEPSTSSIIVSLNERFIFIFICSLQHFENAFILIQTGGTMK